MMDFFSDIFEKFLNVLAVIGLIGGTICGGIIGYPLDHVFLGLILGFLATFVSEIVFFWFYLANYHYKKCFRRSLY